MIKEDNFAEECRRIANLIANNQSTLLEDPFMVIAAKLYLQSKIAQEEELIPPTKRNPNFQNQK